MRTPRRHRLATAVHCSLLMALPALAMAQEPSGTATEEARTLDTVQVTGTRIKRAEVQDKVPVQTLTREDIERTGLTSIGDIVQELTGAGSALNTKFNSSGNFGFPPDGSGVGAGSTTVDLRHLGTKRVLVLVDGMRWVNESSASGVGAAVDLNTIPLALVERIDILEDGASSLYGSDAIAGVVNVITRRNFDGAQISTQYGEYEKGDGETGSVDLAWGHAGDRFQLFLGASYVKQEEIASADREQARFPVPGTGIALASSNIPHGRMRFRDPNTGISYDIVTNTGITAPRYVPGQPACPSTRVDDFHCFTNADRFNFSPFNLVLTPSERAGIFGQARFDFSENVNGYVKALFNRRESTNQAAAEPVLMGPGSGGNNDFAENILISATNPFNPFGFDLRSVDDPNIPGNQANLTAINFRPTAGGPRRFEQEVDTTYIGAGLEGVFGTRWFWDVNAAYSKNKAEQTNFGSYNIRNIAIALGPVATCNATPGCVPLNIFGGPGGITPAMFGWIQPIVRDESEQELTQVTANLSGDLFEMWAGPLSFATGYEYRNYEGYYQPDAITVRGEYNGVPSLPTAGEYDVNELYAELNVPLLSDSTWGDKLDLSLAGRYSDYSTFGSNFTPKYGLRWQLTDEFVLRTTYAEGFRAPSLGELFGTASRFDAQLNDPCSRGPQGQPNQNPANCAALGVPADYRQASGQISVITGGNSNLQPEETNSFSAGFVWSPSILENTALADQVDIEATFYRHDLEGAIQAPDAQTILNNCVATLDPTFCGRITRAANGEITNFPTVLENAGGIKTDGWDVDLYWTFPESAIGTFKLSWLNTFVTRYEAISANGARQPQRPGVEVANSAIPEWTSNATLDWKSDRWTASWTARHISDLVESCGGAASFPICGNDPAPGRNRLGSTTFHDVQVGYKFDWLRGLQLLVGANNVFGKEPPICLSCSLNGYDASTYDVPGGGFWYVRADLRF
jgi:iron complex outermembrane receptor protein